MSSIEPIRGCGYRKVGGLYLVGSGITHICDRLPFNLPSLCPTCGSGIKPHRGFQWINPTTLLSNHKPPCSCPPLCRVCYPTPDPSGLMWVGNKYYTPSSFTSEAQLLGVSKRISHVPKNLVLNKTVIYLAHRKAGSVTVDVPTLLKSKLKQTKPYPAIFYAFIPTRIEKLLWESEASPDVLSTLKSKNITPVIIPDNKTAHSPSTPLTSKTPSKYTQGNLSALLS